MYCCQLNCHKSSGVVANLVKNLPQSNCLALVQEPAQYRGGIPGLGGYQGYQAAGRVRAAIIASPDINVWKVDAFCANDISTIIVKGEREELYVCSVYLDILHTGDTSEILGLASTVQTVEAEINCGH